MTYPEPDQGKDNYMHHLIRAAGGKRAIVTLAQWPGARCLGQVKHARILRLFDDVAGHCSGKDMPISTVRTHLLTNRCHRYPL